MKSHRLLSVLLLLQAYGRLSGRELARRLEVSERTVHRDMEALSASGVPVFALRGARGGWQLDEQWRTQVPGLEPAELRALLLAQPRVLGDTRLSGAAERAMGKILAALPANLRDQAALLRQRLYVDTAGWRGGNESLSMLNVVQDAVARDRKLSMLYRHEGESAERLVDPLGLVAKGSAWYLVALTPRGLRTYRVSRIERADVLDVAAERPAGFDLETYWQTSTREFRDAMPNYPATLRLHPAAADRFRMWCAWAILEEKKPDADGWVAFRAKFDSEENAAFIVMGMGARAEVVSPLTLRARVIEQAKEIIRASRR